MTIKTRVRPHIRNYDMKFHIGFSKTKGGGKIHGEILQRLRFLRRKLRDVLSTGDKIFVCRTRDDDETLPLRVGAALRRFGPNLLLWVTPAAEPETVGRVAPIAEGVLKGQIERDSEWMRFKLDTWLVYAGRLCLWRPAEAQGR